MQRPALAAPPAQLTPGGPPRPARLGPAFSAGLAGDRRDDSRAERAARPDRCRMPRRMMMMMMGRDGDGRHLGAVQQRFLTSAPRFSPGPSPRGKNHVQYAPRPASRQRTRPSISTSCRTQSRDVCRAGRVRVMLEHNVRRYNPQHRSPCTWMLRLFFIMHLQTHGSSVDKDVLSRLSATCITTTRVHGSGTPGTGRAAGFDLPPRSDRTILDELIT